MKHDLTINKAYLSFLKSHAPIKDTTDTLHLMSVPDSAPDTNCPISTIEQKPYAQFGFWKPAVQISTPRSSLLKNTML